MVLTCCHFEFGSLWQYFHTAVHFDCDAPSSHTLNCDSDLPGGSFDWGHSMTVLLVDAFLIVILN